MHMSGRRPAQWKKTSKTHDSHVSLSLGRTYFASTCLAMQKPKFCDHYSHSVARAHKAHDMYHFIDRHPMSHPTIRGRVMYSTPTSVQCVVAVRIHQDRLISSGTISPGILKITSVSPRRTTTTLRWKSPPEPETSASVSAGLQTFKLQRAGRHWWIDQGTKNRKLSLHLEALHADEAHAGRCKRRTD